MQRLHLFALSASLLAATFGCGSKESSAPVASGTPAASDTAPATASSQTAAAPAAPVVLPVQPSSGPEEVVAAFLNAMRDGNSGIAGGLLTEQARAETTKHQWPVQPPGAPSATYQIGQPAFVDQAQTGVHVPCLWTEPDGAGGTVEFQVTWALRKSHEGWRVAGFATEVVPGKPQYYFNFEDIAELRKTQEEAEAALVAAYGEEPAGEVAGRPEQSPK